MIKAKTIACKVRSYKDSQIGVQAWYISPIGINLGHLRQSCGKNNGKCKKPKWRTRTYLRPMTEIERETTMAIMVQDWRLLRGGMKWSDVTNSEETLLNDGGVNWSVLNSLGQGANILGGIGTFHFPCNGLGVGPMSMSMYKTLLGLMVRLGTKIFYKK